MNELVQFKMDSKLSQEINEIEQYLLEFGLNWKLSYTTPYDFLMECIEQLGKSVALSMETSKNILNKAFQVTNLILLCILFIDIYSIQKYSK